MDQYSEADVRSALAPYHARIRAVILAGFAEWLAVSECRAGKGFSPVLYPRTISNYVFDAVARKARTEFAADPTVQVRDEPQTVKFCFGSVVIGRFKKADEDNLGQNIITQAVLDFTDPQLCIPGLPPAAAKVEFVWTIDELGTAIESVQVVARDRDRLLWSYEIDDAIESGDVITLLPGGEPDGDEPLVRPKTTVKADASGE